jgi:hypothetical protein
MATRKKNDSMTFEIVNVTPLLAGVWLEKVNPKHRNRKVSERIVDEYAMVMAEGEWSASASQISFTVDGALDNGQHRLHAITRAWELLDQPADFGIPMGVLRGTREDDFLKIDVGRSRTVSQFLEGKYALERATAARLIYMALTDGRFHSHKINPHATLEFEHTWDKDLAPIAARSKAVGKQLRVPASVVLAVMGQARRSQWGWMVDSFLESLNSGEGLSHGDPQLALLKASAIRDRSGSSKYAIPYAYIVRAWNAYTKGASLTRFTKVVNADGTVDLGEVRK